MISFGLFAPTHVICFQMACPPGGATQFCLSQILYSLLFVRLAANHAGPPGGFVGPSSNPEAVAWCRHAKFLDTKGFGLLAPAGEAAQVHIIEVMTAGGARSLATMRGEFP